jgi:hypothetical protein
MLKTLDYIKLHMFIILDVTALCIVIGTKGFLRLSANGVNQYCKQNCNKLTVKLRTVHYENIRKVTHCCNNEIFRLKFTHT